MQTSKQRNCLIFSGTVREFRVYLSKLPTGITLRAFILSRLH
ncbi:MAG: hypothetical protein ACYCXI_04015 [Dethiobacteraceae bacterium]|jgi:hypothetical protein